MLDKINNFYNLIDFIYIADHGGFQRRISPLNFSLFLCVDNLVEKASLHQLHHVLWF